ncbi:MAG: VOC family protein [Candidatus Cloacimonadaceae bacterium]|nr:VOC family protein [Candidatus Cloacimonadaceae bacterium]
MIVINPYLNFNGNCREAFEFYKSVFGGDFSYVGHFKDMPAYPERPLPEHLKDKIMHMSLPISTETSLMASDAVEEFGQKVNFDGNIELMVSADSRAEADAIWAKLSEGATITMPMEVAFWGDYFGSLTDKFGVRWMVISPADK